jgi:hypothetical protein
MMETIHEESFEDDYRSQQQVPSVSQAEDAERTVPQNGFYNVGYHETPQSRKAPLRMKRPPRFEAPKPPVPTQTHQTQIPTAQLEIVDRLGEGGNAFLQQLQHLENFGIAPKSCQIKFYLFAIFVINFCTIYTNHLSQKCLLPGKWRLQIFKGIF